MEDIKSFKTVEEVDDWFSWADQSKRLSSTQLKSPLTIICVSEKSGSELNILRKKNLDRIAYI